ncbi:glycosyltransferase family 4 protein [Methylicorpusculum sp.]|uniref:glycosyltransferase family 4 protein n=2 Tax=Methylicorpusculum sp. TaxID=2713644 RepID=UPI00273215E9|nr:glycosyltransferase family 4 protein [Methylicorpusculum sp.]MDP2178140.1 glycosyltransferase family 4 protein [Methylicorpusculum sp.]MDP3531056.1 glycosyltransferase family 4 protein [Methylicorpusculum sp.]
MKIIFFTKRQYMHKDVIDDRYARVYELPNQLAQQGHRVSGICLSYSKRKEGRFEHYYENGSLLEWHSYNLGAFILPGLWHYLHQAEAFLREVKPDILLGCSDCPHVIITAYLAEKLKIPYFIDLYDNYESFGLAKIPGMLPLYRSGIKNATGVSCVSEPLSGYIRQRYGHANVLTLESTISGGDFYPRDRFESRNFFNLPENAKLIGVAGSLHRNRGISLLYDSFLQLAESDSALHLALAGPHDASCPIPQHPRIHYLGLLPHHEINTFYNALDLAVVCMRDTEFGRYAFPQKTYEILACKTPILSARLGALKQTLKEYPQCLYEPENQADLSEKIVNLLNNPSVVDIHIPTWSDQAQRLAEWLNP